MKLIPIESRRSSQCSVRTAMGIAVSLALWACLTPARSAAQSPLPPASAPGSSPASTGVSSTGDITPSASDVDAAVVAAISPAPQDYYGAWVLLPPLLTIVLAIAMRQVIPALVFGILAASAMTTWIGVPGGYTGAAVFTQWPIDTITTGVKTYCIEAAIVDAGASNGHIKIIIFTLTIGGMVGVMAANGGTAAVVRSMSRWASTRRRGQLTTWFAGLVVFFDDYANAMIVGPAMRPVTDRLGISRAKLAYIVDSTAAPVASIALIGTWVGAEIGYIGTGMSGLDATPAFLAGVSPYTAFLQSLPYRFYAILALVMVVWIALLDRDFGPMRKREGEAALPISGEGDLLAAQRDDAVEGRAWYAALPVGALVLLTLWLLVQSGLPAGGIQDIKGPDGGAAGWADIAREVLSNASPNDSLLYGALGAASLAVLICLVTRSAPIGKAIDAATDSMSRMFPTMVVLVLAWALSAAMQALHLGTVAQALLTGFGLDPRWLPLMVFISACVVSFSTGTSWGTMGILCPATVTIAAKMCADLPVEEALPLFYASIGAVLAGSVFGDHCTLISDTTVLSAMASECSLGEHVWTQLPYALVVALVSTLSGEVLCREFDLSPWVGLGVGSAALLLIVLVFGRRPPMRATA